MKMILQERQTIDLKYSRDHLFTQYAESHGQLLARRLEAWSSTLAYYWTVEYGPNALGASYSAADRPSAGAGAHQTGHYTSQIRDS